MCIFLREIDVFLVEKSQKEQPTTSVKWLYKTTRSHYIYKNFMRIEDFTITFLILCIVSSQPKTYDFRKSRRKTIFDMKNYYNYKKCDVYDAKFF